MIRKWKLRVSHPYGWDCNCARVAYEPTSRPRFAPPGVPAREIAAYDLDAWGLLEWPLVATGEADDLDEHRTVFERILKTAPEHPTPVHGADVVLT